MGGGTKTCTGCGETKGLDGFPRFSRRGRQEIAAACLECKRAKGRDQGPERMEAVRLRKARTVAGNRLAVREYREGLACTGCGRRGTDTRLMLFGKRNVSDAVDRGLCLETVMRLARASTPYCAGCRTAA